MSEPLKTILSQFKGTEDELIPILQAVQKEFGYLSEPAMLDVAKFTSVAESRVFAVASFYAQFRFTPVGKQKVQVCRGTACHVRGAPGILSETERALNIKEGETTEDMEYTLETVACIGCCALSPCAVVGEKVHANLTQDKIRRIFSK